jgi:pyruvate ferredoxin oxidoreductase beta subunit
LSLVGNPAQKEDWWTPPKGDKLLTFIDFARSEGRFAKQFDRDGKPSPALLETQQDRLQNWRML